MIVGRPGPQKGFHLGGIWARLEHFCFQRGGLERHTRFRCKKRVMEGNGEFLLKGGGEVRQPKGRTVGGAIEPHTPGDP